MQAVKEKLQDVSALRKARAEAKAHEKVYRISQKAYPHPRSSQIPISHPQTFKNPKFHLSLNFC